MEGGHAMREEAIDVEPRIEQVIAQVGVSFYTQMTNLETGYKIQRAVSEQSVAVENVRRSNHLAEYVKKLSRQFDTIPFLSFLSFSLSLSIYILYI